MKKGKNKWLLIFLLCLIVVGLCGCNSKKNKSDDIITEEITPVISEEEDDLVKVEVYQDLISPIINKLDTDLFNDGFVNDSVDFMITNDSTYRDTAQDKYEQIVAYINPVLETTVAPGYGLEENWEKLQTSLLLLKNSMDSVIKVMNDNDFGSISVKLDLIYNSGDWYENAIRCNLQITEYAAMEEKNIAYDIMPDLLGLSKENAIIIITDMGYEYDVTYYEMEGKNSNTVVASYPISGNRLTPDTIVIIQMQYDETMEDSDSNISINKNSEQITYDFDNYSFQLPAYWEDLTLIEDNNEEIVFKQKSSYVSMGDGWIFSIIACPSDEVNKDDPIMEVLSNNNGIAYILERPTDIGFIDYENESILEEYIILQDDLLFLKDTFLLK